ncbi:MAG: hypothetical protein QY323_03720 [Patescibacteria group bacterium]|nr:MAG: hypothetical protein QY323_03720 [Patescibacteria group bacterium]
MFFRIPISDNVAKHGALLDHIEWCLETAENNQPDTQRLVLRATTNSPTLVTRSPQAQQLFAGDAAYNAYLQLASYQGYWAQWMSNDQKERVKALLSNVSQQANKHGVKNFQGRK